MTESLLEIEGQKFFVRDGTNDSDVVRSCRTEYVLPTMDGYEPGSFCVDIGAHLGAWTIWAAQEYQGSRLIAIEPIPENQTLFLKNVALNNLDDRVILIRAAAWSTKEPTIVIPYGDESSESGRIHKFIGNVTGLPQSHSQHVVARTVGFAEILSGAPKVWCVKWDAENAETPVIDEASIEDLQRCAWHIGEFHTNLQAIREKMSSAGFVEHAMPAGHFCFQNELPFRVL